MSFDLDKKEFDEAIQNKNYDWIWSAYTALRKECESWKEQCLGKHTDPKDCPSWYDWCSCGGDLVERIDILKKENQELRKSLHNLLNDNTMKEFAKRESERANSNGNRASGFKCKNIQLKKELQDIKQRSIHSDWETATREQLIDCLKFTAAVRDAYAERNEGLVKENRELRSLLKDNQYAPSLCQCAPKDRFCQECGVLEDKEDCEPDCIIREALK